MAKFEAAVGRYIHLTIQGIEYRVFYEESGKGIPIICQHAGGGDGLTWRHLLDDKDITAKYRVIIPDLPYHGPSLPPESVEWWKQEYKLTKSFLFDFHLEFCRALHLERPVFMGNALGGFLALDVALEYPDKFRAVIAVGAAQRGGPATLDTFYHPNVTNDYRRTNSMYFCAPYSPEKYRRAVTWGAMQSPGPITKGDLYYYFREHDLTGKMDKFDTVRCPVYLLTGDYNPTSSVEDTAALAAQIKGAKFNALPGMSHSGMAENPAVFKKYLIPILDEIASQPLQ
jgi:pimeloyl-ACP methyl ester carboxylesterase